MPLRIPHRAYVYSQLVVSLREAISRGEWKDHLPSERVLADLLHVSRMTLRKALAQLQADGLISASAGSAQRRLLLAPAAPSSPRNIIVSIVRRPDVQELPNMDHWQHRLQLRLAELDIPSETLFFTERQLTAKRSSPENWIKGKLRRLWLLVGSSFAMQQWFAEHARGHTLVLGSSSPQADLPSIDRDYRSVGRHAAGFFTGRNHRSIAILGLKQPIVGDRETEQGFQDGLQEKAHVHLHIGRHDGSTAGIHRQLDSLLRRRPAPTALFIYKAYASLATVIRLLQNGCRIPDDLSLIVRDESPYLQALPFDLAHYRTRETEILHHVITRIELYAASPALALTSVRVLSEFHEGNTVARLASV